MADMIRFDLTGLRALNKAFDALRDPATYAAAAAEAAEPLRRALTRYPSRRRGPLPGFPRSGRQRRKVHALVREGKIPYKRTGRLGRSWRIEAGDSGVRLVNDAPYAARVQQAGQQALYHRVSGWPTVESVAEEQAGTAAAIMARVIEARLS